jgi:hypothetical protein
MISRVEPITNIYKVFLAYRAYNHTYSDDEEN